MKDDGYPMREMVNLSCIWHRVIEKQMADLGMTSIQSRMIGYLYFQSRRQRKVFQGQLEEEFKIRKSSVTSVIQILEKKGLVRRTGVPGDGDRASGASGGTGESGAHGRRTQALVFLHP